MENVIAIAVILLIIGFATGYICKSRKRGIKCIGCPDGAKCSGNCSGCSGNCGGAGNCPSGK